MQLNNYDEATLHRLQQVELEMLEDFVHFCDKHKIPYFGIGGTAIGAVRHQGFIPWDDDIDLAFTRKDYERFCRLAQKELRGKYTILNAQTDENYPLFTARMCKNGTIFKEHAMKDVDCSFGIFLDLYAYDNIPDTEIFMKVQAWKVWIFSKLLILCSISRPNLLMDGIRKRLVLGACQLGNKLMALLHISKRGVFLRGKACCTRYNGENTRRLAYLPEARPFTSMINRKDLYPLRKMKFEHLELTFPNHMHPMLQAYYGDYMQLPPKEKRYNHCPYQLDFGDER